MGVGVDSVLGHVVNVARKLAGRLGLRARPITLIPTRPGFSTEKVGSCTLGVNTLKTPHQRADCPASHQYLTLIELAVQGTCSTNVSCNSRSTVMSISTLIHHDVGVWWRLQTRQDQAFFLHCFIP